MEYVGQFLAGAAVVVVLVLVNGGFIYKTTCPLPSGGAQTSWTYGINDIVPYIRSTKAPCQSHTGTRLALSGIGVWPLGHKTKETAITPADRAAADSLQVATSAITAEYARERVVSAALTREAKAKGLTPAIRQKLVRIINGGSAAYQGIKDKLDQSSEASDPRLTDAKESLSTWLGYQIDIDNLFLSSSSYNDWRTKVTAQYGSKLPAVGSRLRYLSLVIQARYPQVKDWGFLPAK